MFSSRIKEHYNYQVFNHMCIYHHIVWWLSVLAYQRICSHLSSSSFLSFASSIGNTLLDLIFICINILWCLIHWSYRHLWTVLSQISYLPIIEISSSSSPTSVAMPCLALITKRHWTLGRSIRCSLRDVWFTSCTTHRGISFSLESINRSTWRGILKGSSPSWFSTTSLFNYLFFYARNYFSFSYFI